MALKRGWNEIGKRLAELNPEKHARVVEQLNKMIEGEEALLALQQERPLHVSRPRRRGLA